MTTLTRTGTDIRDELNALSDAYLLALDEEFAEIICKRGVNKPTKEELETYDELQAELYKRGL